MGRRKRMNEENQNRYDTPTRNAVRLTLVAVILGLVYTIKDFSDMVNLVGGLANCFMGFILPPLLHVRVNKDNISGGSVFLHYLIVAFGAVTMVTSTAVTINGIIHPPKNPA